MKIFGMVAVLAAVIAITPLGAAESAVSVIPQPVAMEIRSGEFLMTPETVIAVDRGLEPVGQQLASMLRKATGYPLEVRTGTGPASCPIVLRQDAMLDALGREGYRLLVTPGQVTVSGATPAGVFYGCQTLRQLFPDDIFSRSRTTDVRWTVPCVMIEDQPRFPWRGMHLDVGRYYMPKEFVLKYIDLLALHKMNVFHWHLNEDQGWRIEIKRYPKLTEIGAWRKETVVNRTDEGDGTRHGGYYTQEEIREVVAYAKERFITIVPEIEMPGHSMAALAAYPELSCTGGPFEVQTRWGIKREVYCAGNEAVFTFLENVLAETMELFPGEYIHIGGDECPKDRWKECAQCQARIRAEGLTDEHELQSYFIRRIEKFLNARNRRLIGWDEILEGGLAPNATVMSWRGEEGGINAARAAHDVVMAPNIYTYFDYYQSELDPAIGHFLPLERVYGYNPTPVTLTAAEQEHILGVQGQVWTEHIPTPEQAEYMAFPRACALAEVAWTPLQRKDFIGFHKRLERHLERLSLLSVNYRRLDPPQIEIGRWASGETDETYMPIEWDVTSPIERPGTYVVRFSYTHGAHRLDIQQVELLNGQMLIAADRHEGRTGGANHRNTYILVVPEEGFDRQTPYRLRAVVRSDGGSDSNGVVTISEFHRQ